MAILKTVDLPNGLHVDNAYHTLTFIKTDRNNETQFTLSVFVSKEYSMQQENEIGRYNSTCFTQVGDNAEDIKRQIYNTLKQTPEFADSVDI